VKKFLSIIILFWACSKSNQNKPPIPTSHNNWAVSYNASGYDTGVVTISDSLYHIDSTNGVAQCLYENISTDTTLSNPYSGRIYLFQFTENSINQSWGIIFGIPASGILDFNFPLNHLLTFNLSQPIYQNLLPAFGVNFDKTKESAQPDSVSITITITRNSGGTIDGTFSGNFFGGFPIHDAVLKAGIFKNVPLKRG
jgi:hypothetical protein